MTHQKQMGTTTPINLKKGFRVHLLVFLLTIPVIWVNQCHPISVRIDQSKRMIGSIVTQN